MELSFTRPAKPVDNGYVETVHDKFREERLSTLRFLDVADARRQIDVGREHYNTVRPHGVVGGCTPQEYGQVFAENDARESALTA